MAEFYTRVFGWQTKQLGPGRIHGGFFTKTKDTQYPWVVIAVDDIREAMKQVEEASGKILGGQKPGEPDDIPGVGLHVSFIDTEGNRVEMFTADRHDGRS